MTSRFIFMNASFRALYTILVGFAFAGSWALCENKKKSDQA